MLLLAADIGGTHCRFLLAEWRRQHLHILQEKTFPSHDYPDVLPILQQLLHQGVTPPLAVFAVAGPVTKEGEHQTVKLTNLPWRLDNRELQQQIGIKAVHFINDFEAIGYGIDSLPDDQFVQLQPGKPEPQGLRAIIGAGTGLGQSLMLWQGDAYRVHSTEGGHCTFGPADDQQHALWQFLHRRYDHVSWEHLVSGPGLVNIYRFLEQQQPALATDELEQAMKQGDPAAAISQFAQQAHQPLATQALELFVKLYGAQAGNLALTTVPSGGLFIAGGIAPKILASLTTDQFMQAFLNKGDMRALLQRIPIKIVRDSRVGLLGAINVATRTAETRMR